MIACKWDRRKQEPIQQLINMLAWHLPDLQLGTNSVKYFKGNQLSSLTTKKWIFLCLSQTKVYAYRTVFQHQQFWIINQRKSFENKLHHATINTYQPVI